MIYYSPDYKSEPDLPDDFGLMEVACSDGRHRFLPDALRCGCLKTINPEAERTRLERLVIEAAKKWKLERDDGDNEKWSVHYVKMCDAIQALIDFESKQEE